MARTRAATSTAARCDRLLDAVVAFLATWTLVYHACLFLRLGVAWAVGLEVVALVACALLVRRFTAPVARTSVAEHDDVPAPPPAPPAHEGPSPSRRPIVVAVTAAGVAALGMATGAPWLLVWVPWLVAAGAGVWWTSRTLGNARRDVLDEGHPPSQVPGRVETAVVLAWTVGLAALATFTLRPNPDDLYYVNLSQWVAEHGTFPLRDTIFADLTYPMSNWPPVASYDALIGAVAHLAGTRAGDVEYVVVPALATTLSVLALWRLLRAWRVQRVALVISVALVFLLLDGTSSYGPPGNLFLTRLWQGKVILLCLLVPTLLVHALRHVERPSRATGLRLALGGVASVGLSTSAIFLTPLIAFAGAVPLLPRSRARAAAGFGLMAAYPLAAGIATKVLGGRSADDFGARRQFRFDPSWFGHEIFLTGPIAALAVFSVLVGCLLVPVRAARITTAVLVLATGLVLVPGATRLSYDVTGLGPTLWRVSWGCTVAALVGLVLVAGGTWLHRRYAEARPRQRWSVGIAVTVVLGLLVASGSPIWAGDTGNQWQAPFHWERTDGSRYVAARVIQSVGPGRLVLAPDSLAITIAVTTTDVKTVAPRDYYLHYLRDVPSFHSRERLALVDFANEVGPWRQQEVSRALRVLHVDVACLATRDIRRVRGLQRAGLTPMLTTRYFECLQKT